VEADPSYGACLDFAVATVSALPRPHVPWCAARSAADGGRRPTIRGSRCCGLFLIGWVPGCAGGSLGGPGGGLRMGVRGNHWGNPWGARGRVPPLVSPRCPAGLTGRALLLFLTSPPRVLLDGGVRSGTVWAAPFARPGRPAGLPARSAGAQCPHARFSWCAGVVLAVCGRGLEWRDGSWRGEAGGCGRRVRIPVKYAHVCPCSRLCCSPSLG
jgi:hypothetical protein